MNLTDNGYRWVATPAPLAGRYDDIFFISPDIGWSVNGNGQILKTEDGGGHWQIQKQLEGVYLRCIGMANSQVGWVGSVTPGRQLFHTHDGGQNWVLVDNLPKTYISREQADAPSAVCGMWVLDEQHVFASGTNYPERPARFLKTEDGGQSWWARDMEDVATLLVDIYFKTEQEGWVVGGRSVRPNPRRSDVVPTVLKTEDGGRTWRELLGDSINAPLGEWGWKIQFLDEEFGVVACENLNAGAILITEDGGQSWRRQEIRNTEGEMINENLEGIGFLNRQIGWVGGWGDKVFNSGRTSGTTDGGRTWTDLTATWPQPVPGQGYSCPPRPIIGQYINRFRFVGNPVTAVYASGNTVYKYTNQDLFEPMEREITAKRLLRATELHITADQSLIPLTVPDGAKALSIVLYDRFAGKVRTLLEEQNPPGGERLITWDLRDDNGQKLTPGQFMVRVTCDNESESRLIFPEPTGDQLTYSATTPHLLRED